jgi:hypothetical protein
MAQVVECLPSKCEVLSSNPNTTKKKRRGEGWPGRVLWKELIWTRIRYKNLGNRLPKYKEPERQSCGTGIQKARKGEDHDLIVHVKMLGFHCSSKGRPTGRFRQEWSLEKISVLESSL